jgi:hypothetical protein
MQGRTQRKVVCCYHTKRDKGCRWELIFHKARKKHGIPRRKLLDPLWGKVDKKQERQWTYYVTLRRVLATIVVVGYTGCFKKSFTNLKTYRNLYRGHTQRFELSKCSKTHRGLPRIVIRNSFDLFFNSFFTVPPPSPSTDLGNGCWGTRALLQGNLQLWKHTENINNVLNCQNVAKHTEFYLG